MNGYMGIDIGTSGCKVLIFDEQGRCHSQAYREYNLICPRPGWAELDAEEVIDKCFDVMAEVVRNANTITVRAIGISSQGEAFVPVAADGRLLHHALVSSDNRAAAYAQTWADEFGRDRLYQITGHTPHTLFSLFKLLWLRDHLPDIWKQTWKFLCFEDLLQFRLGVMPHISWPLAGRTMLFDVRKHIWNQEILAAVGLLPAQLAQPAPSGSNIGTIPPTIAEQLSLNPEAIVVTGGHDQPCGALGAGVTEPGAAVYSTGTVECITPVFHRPTFSEGLRDHNLCTYDYTLENMYTTVAYNITGGSILKWFRDQFGQVEIDQARQQDRDPYELLLEAADSEPTNLLILPYFGPSGTPYFDPNISGAIIGLTLATTRDQIIRALLEALALEMRLNLEILEQAGCSITELRVVGGGAKSSYWNQLKADVLSKPIIVTDVTEAACRGAALLACAADRQLPVRQLAESWARPHAKLIPNSTHAAHYERQFTRYKHLYPSIKKLSSLPHYTK
ncbi:MAG: hypothetical protein JW709_04115 [Sedimentisphaerales bacterium]|nr:hypothetical protein [Sedimentisphaerales bacterium]